MKFNQKRASLQIASGCLVSLALAAAVCLFVLGTSTGVEAGDAMPGRITNDVCYSVAPYKASNDLDQRMRDYAMLDMRTGTLIRCIIDLITYIFNPKHKFWIKCCQLDIFHIIKKCRNPPTTTPSPEVETTTTRMPSTTGSPMVTMKSLAGTEPPDED